MGPWVLSILMMAGLGIASSPAMALITRCELAYETNLAPWSLGIAGGDNIGRGRLQCWDATGNFFVTPVHITDRRAGFRFGNCLSRGRIVATGPGFALPVLNEMSFGVEWKPDPFMRGPSQGVNVGIAAANVTLQLSEEHQLPGSCISGVNARTMWIQYPPAFQPPPWAMPGPPPALPPRPGAVPPVYQDGDDLDPGSTCGRGC